MIIFALNVVNPDKIVLLLGSKNRANALVWALAIWFVMA